jgi:dATP pyrophosphohydrolase
MAGQHFRAGVVIVVRHPDRHRGLAFERSDAAGSWQLPQGGLDIGEEPIEGAWRELMEETGLDANVLPLVDWQMSKVYEIYPHWRYRYAPGVTENTEHVFGLELPAPQVVQLSPQEHVRQEWVDWREAAKRVFSWTNVEALRELGRIHGQVL